jgi:uncharacterized protein
MDSMPRVVHFEVHADDPERAAKFYSTAFGWKIDKWGGPIEYWMVDTGEGMGINGGLLKRSQPSEATVNTVSVEDIDASLKSVAAAGGKLVRPKYPIPGVGWLAYCEDTEGNQFGMMQPDDNAK